MAAKTVNTVSEGMGLEIFGGAKRQRGERPSLMHSEPARSIPVMAEPGEACPKRRPNGIEMFYNPKQKHVRNGMLSPVEFEKQQRR